MVPNFRPRLGPAAAFAAISFVGARACAQTPDAPTVPPALKAPAGQVVFLQAMATGVQIYECRPRTGGGNAWVFVAPEATLVDGAGKALGKHFAGPTWQAVDGSTVVGKVVAQDAGPDPSAIPWLLLAAKTNTGAGLFASVSSVQRVATVGGVAPSEPCLESTLKQVARVPYSASYYFYQAAR